MRGSLASRFAQSLRRHFNPAPELRTDGVAVVATEHFISGVARQCHRDLAARDRANDARRNLRTVSEGLVVYRRQFRNDRARLLRGHPDLTMVSAQMPRHLTGVRRFVESSLVEAYGEGLDRPARLGLHKRNDG